VVGVWTTKHKPENKKVSDRIFHPSSKLEQPPPLHLLCGLKEGYDTKRIHELCAIFFTYFSNEDADGSAVDVSLLLDEC
jgi:hypothetical protein